MRQNSRTVSSFEMDVTTRISISFELQAVSSFVAAVTFRYFIAPLRATMSKTKMQIPFLH
jgi:hypothetical protein